MDDDMDGEHLDNTLVEFNTYEDYLDSQMTAEDLFYLEDQELARQLIEVGYHGKGEILARDQFHQRKAAYQEAKKNRQAAQVKALSHVGCPIEGNPFLQALAKREESLRNGRTTTILFIRQQEPGKNEKSAYIDLAHRMKTDDFGAIFMNKKKLQPKKSDLSFYDWDVLWGMMTDSPNFRVQADGKEGLLFRNKRDRKMINVNPEAPDPGDFTTREVVECPDYTQVVFFDHQTRRKN